MAVVLSVCLGAACSTPVSEGPDDESATGAPSETERSPAERTAYFGDLHVHTRYSYDAFVFGTRAAPDAAYEFAKGNAISHPGGFDLQLDRPLDFQAVADHANYLGMLPAMSDPDSSAYDHPAAETVRSARTAEERRGVFAAMQPYVRYMSDSDPSIREHLDMDVVRSAWSDTIASANRHTDPGTFTAFIGYEYTSAGGIYNNLHRNVVFRGDRGPDVPFSRLDSFNPEDLWSKMDEWREAGMEAIAIPHNMNGSGGRMFEYEYFDGGAIDDAYVQQRTRNEPIVEMTQAKGTSETHPALSPNDEWADFEIMPFRISTQILSEPPGSYVRDALRRGLTIESGGVGNPYKFGFIGSSDTHVAAGIFREDKYTVPSGLMQADAQRRGSVPVVDDDEAIADTLDDGSGRRYLSTAATLNGASGLAGVWAEENTRASLFDAMRRKETFATSGSRMRLRFFAGATIGRLDVSDPDLVSKAYQHGVPMGGDLRGAAGVGAPSFLVNTKPTASGRVTRRASSDPACCGGKRSRFPFRGRPFRARKENLSMHDWQSLAHVRWECKYHVVIIPKFRRKILYGQLRKQVGRILRALCDQRGVELLEGKAMADHVHLCLSIPPKYSVAHTVGFLKGKSAVQIHRKLLRERRMTGLHFWSTGYCVSTVGLDEGRIREYIREQEQLEAGQGDLDLK